MKLSHFPAHIHFTIIPHPQHTPTHSLSLYIFHSLTHHFTASLSLSLYFICPINIIGSAIISDPPSDPGQRLNSERLQSARHAPNVSAVRVPSQRISVGECTLRSAKNKTSQKKKKSHKKPQLKTEMYHCGSTGARTNVPLVCFPVEFSPESDFSIPLQLIVFFLRHVYLARLIVCQVHSNGESRHESRSDQGVEQQTVSMFSLIFKCETWLLHCWWRGYTRFTDCEALQPAVLFTPSCVSINYPVIKGDSVFCCPKGVKNMSWICQISLKSHRVGNTDSYAVRQARLSPPGFLRNMKK